MAGEEVKTVLSEKGHAMLLHNSFKYSKAHTSKNGVIRWRCYIRTCTAKIYTSVASANVIMDQIGEHNHGQCTSIGRQALSTSVKRKAVENTSEKPAKLIHSELRHNQFKMDVTTKDIECVRRNLYMARRKIMPKLPKNREEVLTAVKSLKLKTDMGEDFVMAVSEANNIIVFSCFTNLHFLNSVDTLYMDGTFQFSSNFFYQMFTIHAFKNGHYVPVIFCLLPDKKTETYVNVFRIIIERCNTLDINFKPSQIVIDFELAIHNACRLVWSSVCIVGCRFHLSQNWFKKIQNLGLVAEYKDSTSAIGNYLKLYFGIQYLEPSHAVDFFNNELHYLMPHDRRVVLFRNYLHNNYFHNGAAFPPSLWAGGCHFPHRTTNACESFHSRFNASFYGTHPNIFVFTDTLISFQTENYVKIRSVQSVKCPRKKVQDKILYRLERLDELSKGTISTFTFVKSICYNYLPKTI